MRFWPRRDKPAPPVDPTNNRWLSASESPFGVSVFDCRPFTQNRMAGSGSQDVALRFVQLRTWQGEELDHQQFPILLPTPSGLQYPVNGPSQPHGPVFKASAMEEKWDLYHRDGRLYFSRSWTGEPHYVAQIVWGTSAWTIAQVSQAESVRAEAEWSVRAVDYLIKSHLYNLVAPHPLRTDFQGDDHRLALASFADFGRRAHYGTFGDLMYNAALEQALWGRGDSQGGQVAVE
jgi:hypothetical protein